MRVVEKTRRPEGVTLQHRETEKRIRGNKMDEVTPKMKERETPIGKAKMHVKNKTDTDKHFVSSG